MDIFNRKTKMKHIEQFETAIANLLVQEFPQFKKVIKLSKYHGISFTSKPNGIYISRSYNPEAFKEIQKHHRTHFNLTGVSIYNIKQQEFIDLKLNYSFDSLIKFEIDNPEYFHKNFDLNNLKKGEIILEQLPNENPDKEIVEKILNSLSNEQLGLLELDDTIELEIDNKLYYTILDMEDGNYIAIDKSKKVYRLIHDHSETIREIADNPIDFFNFYNGNKDELEELKFK